MRPPASPPARSRRLLQGLPLLCSNTFAAVVSRVPICAANLLGGQYGPWTEEQVRGSGRAVSGQTPH
eukprot:scaffold1074_cov409-Prasinococcus_capsulatus_cf.AAC.15